MRILMIAPQPFFEARGTPFSVLGRLRALSSLGHEVDLLTYHVGKDVDIPGVRIIRTPRVPFIRAVKLGPSLPKVLLDGLLLMKALRLLSSGDYDLLHTHEEASFFGVALATLFGLPHLYDMHSSPTEQLSNFRYTRLGPLVRLFDWAERKVVRASDAVITICPSLAEHVSRIDGHVPHVMIENLALERDPLAIPDQEVEAFRAAHPQVAGRQVVLYTGTFETYQGLDLLIESARRVVSRHPGVLFLMVGGKPGQVSHYQQMVDQMGLAGHFHFTGTRPPEELPLFMRLAHVLVSPRTTGTNTPLKLYAYLQSGRPIVATDLYTHTQVLDSEVSFLAQPEPCAFAQAVLMALEDEARASAVAASARRLFEARYSYQSYLDKTESILGMAVRRNGGTPKAQEPSLKSPDSHPVGLGGRAR